MTRIADSALETVRQRIDIAELVREYVPGLKRAGRHWKACCPFHQEKTPSFTVNPERQIFHCFGCGEGGDAFTFLMKMENLSFTEAARKLAERSGVQIAQATESLGPAAREALKLREALAFAREFYQKVLSSSPEADAARRYLAKRGLDRATGERFGLGFAPADGSSFLQAALGKGLAPELLAKAGLLAMKEETGRYRDYFRGRILYPIQSAKGETVGFGARAMGDAQPKYLNSPDTPAFSKGRVLYGLFEGLSQIRKLRRALLMEGYMDVLAAHQFGLTHACAPLGTAVTPEHAEQLKRYADGVVIVFDPDNAGAAASLRGAELLLERGLIVRIATAPDGLDPDELLHQKGVSGFQECLDRAVDLPDFQTSGILAKFGGGPLSAEQKAEAAREVLSTILKASDEVLKGEWVRRLGSRLQVDEASLRLQMEKMKSGAREFSGKRPGAIDAAGRRGAIMRSGAGSAAPASAMPSGDKELLAALFGAPEAAADPARVAEDDFDSEPARRIFTRLRAFAGPASQPLGPASQPLGPAAAWSGDLLRSLDPRDAAVASALLLDERSDADPDGAVRKIVDERRLVRRYRQLREQWLRSQDLGSTPDPDLAREYHLILKQMSDRRLLDRV